MESIRKTPATHPPLKLPPLPQKLLQVLLLWDLPPKYDGKFLFNLFESIYLHSGAFLPNTVRETLFCTPYSDRDFSIK